MKRGQTIISVIISIIMVAAIAIPISMSIVRPATQLTYVASEANASVLVNGSTFTLAHYPVDESASLLVKWYGSANKLQTLVKGSNYTLLGEDTTGETTTFNGTIYLKSINTTVVQNGTLTTYAYQGSAYADSAASRSILSLIPLGLAVGALMIAFSLVA